MTKTLPDHERDTTTKSVTTINALAAKAQHWGVMTWLANIGGCFVGMIPLALPLPLLLTIITFFSGIAAMVLGVRGYRMAPAPERHDAERAQRVSGVCARRGARGDRARGGHARGPAPAQRSDPDALVNPGGGAPPDWRRRVPVCGGVV